MGASLASTSFWGTGSQPSRQSRRMTKRPPKKHALLGAHAHWMLISGLAIRWCVFLYFLLFFLLRSRLCRPSWSSRSCSSRQCGRSNCRRGSRGDISFPAGHLDLGFDFNRLSRALPLHTPCASRLSWTASSGLSLETETVVAWLFISGITVFTAPQSINWVMQCDVIHASQTKNTPRAPCAPWHPPTCRFGC